MSGVKHRGEVSGPVTVDITIKIAGQPAINVSMTDEAHDCAWPYCTDGKSPRETFERALKVARAGMRAGAK